VRVEQDLPEVKPCFWGAGVVLVGFPEFPETPFGVDLTPD